jgi:hypothetical protein
MWSFSKVLSRNMEHEAFICCYFDQEVRAKKITLFHSDFSNKISFCGELLQKFLGRRGGVLEVTPGQKGWCRVKDKVSRVAQW